MSVIAIRSPGQVPAGCGQNGGSVVWTQASDPFSWKKFGIYVNQLNNFGPQPGTITMWNNDPICWGVTNVSRHTEQNGIGAYPSVTRGWTFNDNVMAGLSTPGTNDWTTQAGMGVQLSALTKAKVKWGIAKTPLAPPPGSRFNCLIDIYTHSVPTPAFNVPVVNDISIMQMEMDANYYGPTYVSEHGFAKTIGGIQYIWIVNESDGFGVFATNSYLLGFCRPTSATDGLAANSLWGLNRVTHDVAAILAFFQQANPTDDNGQPIRNGHTGAVVTSPLIDSAQYLTSFNWGFEQDYTQSTSDQFVTDALGSAMQNEPDP